MKNITLEDCKIEIIAEQEPTSIDFALGFKETGADHSEYIAKVLEDDGDNVWLWCIVEVKLSYKGILHANDILGCCAYDNEEQFKEDGYYQDMVATCLSELNDQINELNK